MANYNTVISGSGYSGPIKNNNNCNILVMSSEINISENNNTGINGSDYSGPIERNNNCTIAVVSSVLNLADNNNAKIKLNNSKTQILSCNNVEYEGEEDEIILKKETNPHVKSSKNKGTFSGNTNLSFKGVGNEVVFNNNTNASYNGNRGKVMAEANTNLTIEGDENQIKVENTTNHHLKRTQKSGSENTVELVVERLQDFLGFFGGNGINSFGGTIFVGNFNGNCPRRDYKVSLAYPKEAAIQGNFYSVGAFQFLMDNLDSPSVVKLRLVGGPFEIKCDGPTKCRLLGAGEELLIKAPKVTRAADNNGVYLHLDGDGPGPAL